MGIEELILTLALGLLKWKPKPNLYVEEALLRLKKNLEGSIEWDDLHKKLYATDASVYKMTPLAVAFPKNKKQHGCMLQ